MRKYLTKFFPLARMQAATKAEGEASANPYRVEGLASVFGVVDAYGDVMLPGAFAGLSLPIPMLLAHKSNGVPIGLWDSAQETSEGLRVSGELTKGIQDADESALAYAAGSLRGLSVGGWAIGTLNKSGGIDIEQFETREITLTPFPACPGAELGAKEKTAQDDAKPIANALDLEALNKLFS